MFSLASKFALRAFNLVEPRLSIVLFHRVLAACDPMLSSEPDTARFATQMRWLRDSFHILPLRDALARLHAGRLPAGALCVTFDDGYRDNAINALPVLRALGIPATFFVTTRYLDGGLMWNDRVIEAMRVWPHAEVDMSPYGLPIQSFEHGREATAVNLLGHIKYLPYAERERVTADLFARSHARTGRVMMNAEEIRLLQQSGMEIGGHTVTHPILCAIDDAQARQEIAENKTALESIIGTTVETFAYPNGRPRQDYQARHIAVVRDCGYRSALTTAAGSATRTTSAWQIPRFTPWDRQQTKYVARMLQNYFRTADAVDETAANAVS